MMLVLQLLKLKWPRMFFAVLGSGASPAAWLTLIVILLNTIDKELPDDRMTSLDPITKKPHSRLANAFVDDTMLGKSDSGDLSYEDVIGRLQLISQTWEHLLMFASSTKVSTLHRFATFSLHSYLLMRNIPRRSRLGVLKPIFWLCQGFNHSFPSQNCTRTTGMGWSQYNWYQGGLSQIKEFHHVLYGNSGPGKLMMYSLKYSQMESGLGLHLLEDPTVFISWLTSTWIMSLRQFLYNHNITITLTDCWHVPLCWCKHDQYLMAPALEGCLFTRSNHEHILMQANT